MISYYWVDSESTNNGVKYFTIHNMMDRRTVSETDLARAITENRVVLLNYQLASTGSGRIVRLRTNQIIPEEKMFQANEFNKLIDSYIAGKPVIIDHLELAKNLFSRPRDAAANKFLTRLLDAVNMYMSYMDDVDVRVVIKSEKKAIKLTRDIEHICSSTVINSIENIANTLNMQTEFMKFKDLHKKEFKSYEFIIDMLVKAVNNSSLNNNDINSTINVLSEVIYRSPYTFVGEQMDKVFCYDLLEMYKKSVYDNIHPNFHRLTSTERQNKANDCCMVFVNAYNKYDDKIKTNKANIVHNIRAGGNEAIELLDYINKLDSTDYTIIDKLSDNSNMHHVYEEYLLKKLDETRDIARAIEGRMKTKAASKAVKALGTAVDIGVSSMMSSSNPITAGAGAITKCVTSGAETNKLAEELSDYSIKNNLPSSIVKLISKLKNNNIFYIHMIIYIYEKKLYRNTVDKAKEKYGGKIGSYKGWNDFFKFIYDKFNSGAETLMIKLTPYVRNTYVNSYISIIADLVTVDNRNILIKIFNKPTKEEILYYGIHEVNMRHLEKAWIPAYKIMCMDINYDRVYSHHIEDAIFWKLVEDMYVVQKLDMFDEERDRYMGEYVKIFNKEYKVKFLRSRDVNIDMLKMFKNTKYN